MATDTKNFKVSEFACPCCGKNEVKQELLDKLQMVRDYYGRSMKVNSGYRCPEHNKEVGGKEDSAHLGGWAADIAVADNHERFLLIKANFPPTQEEDDEVQPVFTRIEPNVGRGWVHFDCDPDKPQETLF